MLQVAQGEVDEVGFVLHPGGVAAEVDGLDQGGADPAHRVDDQVTWLGEGIDDDGGDGRQHLAGVTHRLGCVATQALEPRGPLPGRQHRRQTRRSESVGIHRSAPSCRLRDCRGLVNRDTSAWTLTAGGNARERVSRSWARSAGPPWTTRTSPSMGTRRAMTCWA